MADPVAPNDGAIKATSFWAVFLGWLFDAIVSCISSIPQDGQDRIAEFLGNMLKPIIERGVENALQKFQNTVVDAAPSIPNDVQSRIDASIARMR